MPGGAVVQFITRLFLLESFVSNMPPADLPGFYWDESKNRYFPLADRSRQPHSWKASGSSRAAPLEAQESGGNGASRLDDPRPAKRRRLERRIGMPWSFNAVPSTYAVRNQETQCVFSVLYVI